MDWWPLYGAGEREKPLRDDMSLRRSSRRSWHATRDYVSACLWTSPDRPWRSSTRSVVEVDRVGGSCVTKSATKGCNLERRLRHDQLRHAAAFKRYSTKSRARFIYVQKSAGRSVRKRLLLSSNKKRAGAENAVSEEHTQVCKSCRSARRLPQVWHQAKAAASGKNSYLVATYKGLLC